VIEGLEIPSEVILMARILLVLLLVGSWFACVCFDRAAMATEQLIPVKPAYAEAAPESQPSKSSAENEALPEPTPRDQMYLFWLLGKIISYPVDKAEYFVKNQIKRVQNRPIATPASAPVSPNPFESVNYREIPPAPPVNSGVGAAR